MARDLEHGEDFRYGSCIQLLITSTMTTSLGKGSLAASTGVNLRVVTKYRK